MHALGGEGNAVMAALLRLVCTVLATTPGFTLEPHGVREELCHVFRTPSSLPLWGAYTCALLMNTEPEKVCQAKPQVDQGRGVRANPSAPPWPTSGFAGISKTAPSLVRLCAGAQQPVPESAPSDRLPAVRSGVARANHGHKWSG